MTPLSKTVHADLVAVLTGIKGVNKRRIEFADALSECLRITESRRTKIEESRVLDCFVSHYVKHEHDDTCYRWITKGEDNGTDH